MLLGGEEEAAGGGGKARGPLDKGADERVHGAWGAKARAAATVGDAPTPAAATTAGAAAGGDEAKVVRQKSRTRAGNSSSKGQGPMARLWALAAKNSERRASDQHMVRVTAPEVPVVLWS